MTHPASDTDDIPLDLAEALGATADVSGDMLTLYIPDKDQHGTEFGTQRQWVLEAVRLLALIGGGVSIMPPVEGGWQRDDGDIVWEHPVLVYSYIRPEAFIRHLPALRSFLHSLGRETNQGEIAVEFAGQFFRIRNFDKE